MIIPITRLLVVLFLLVVMHFCLSRNFLVPNTEFMPEMVHSIPYEAYAENPNFSDGKTLQLPVEGTIARGFLPEFSDSELTPKLANDVLENPFEVSEDILIQGEWVYQTNCQVCHGAKGDGDGPVTKRGVPPPPSLKTDNVRKMKDGQIYYIISNGKGNMSSYKSQVLREDRWKVIHYIRTLDN